MIPYHNSPGVCSLHFAASVVPSMSRAQITEHRNQANHNPNDVVPHWVAAQFIVYLKPTKARETIVHLRTHKASLLNLQWDVIWK